jgi:hypothetical protein
LLFLTPRRHFNTVWYTDVALFSLPGTDQTVCQQGRFATHLYFVVRGECNAFKTLHHFNPQGACFLFLVSCSMLVFVVPLCIPRTSHSDVLVTRGYILSFRRWAPVNTTGKGNAVGRAGSNSSNGRFTMSLGRLSKGDCFGLQCAGGENYAQNMKYNVSVSG